MAYTNSSLVSYTKISPNKSTRTHAIDTITIHCVVGQCTVQSLGNVFAPTSRRASSNYGIGYDGKIGMYVEEKDRSWCTSSSSNDNRAVTIEVASDTKHPFAVTDKALSSLIKLVADICKRNNIKELKWKGDKSLIGQVDKQNMTVHRWFANKSCPGDYLYNKHSYIADEVNKILGVTKTEVKPETKPTVSTSTSTSTSATKTDVSFSNGEQIKLASNAKYINGKDVPSWVLKNNLYYRGKDNNGNIKFSILKVGAITGIVEKKYVTKIEVFKPYIVQVTASSLNIRKGAGTNYGVAGKITDKGAYTIVEEADGKGAKKWGLLKSYQKNRNGWISLDYTKKR